VAAKTLGCGLLAVILLVAGVSAQEMASLSVSPAKATMLVGDTRTFRAVGKDGRLRHNVRWSISPQQVATLTVNGDEATIHAEHESSNVILTAYADGDSAEATLEIQSGPISNGTVMWSVNPLPGCKVKKMTQAVPTANGPDIYVEEECPQGNFVRALTADGRELWRRQITGAGGVLESFPKPPAFGESVDQSGQHINFQRFSICDSISSGMSKDDVAKLAAGRNQHLSQRERDGATWTFEESGSRCEISFDGKTGTVVKKKKTVVTD
jgi:hypothetical protein